ncbi:MAG: hydroxymethylglutaryl-CoA lyase [Beijerinckiaceae bacterium]
MAGDTVEIVEVSPRDGLQNEPVFIDTADKLRLIAEATAAGIGRHEVTSFVNPKRVPQMRDADEIFAALANTNNARHIGLVLNAKGFERAVAVGCREINYVVVASETFNQRNQGVSIAETLAQWRAISAMARSANIRTTVSIAASFGCPFEGEMPMAKVLGVMEQVLVTPPDEIAFADTIGCGVPAQVRALLSAARRLAPGLKQRCHFHDTRNTGIANALAAVESGVDALDSSIGGLGGCPFAPAATGNIATEDLVYMMNRMGVRTGVALEPLLETARWISGLLGKPVVSALARAGGFPAGVKTAI